MSHKSLVFSQYTHEPFTEHVYQENTSDKCYIAWYTTRECCIQYRSEISGQRTRKTHAPFLRKRVLKDACFYTRLRAFDARVFFCYSLTSMAVFSFSQQKARQKAVRTNTAKNISHKQIPDTFLAMHMVLTNVQLLLEYFCYGLNVNENNTSHRFSVIIACAVAV